MTSREILESLIAASPGEGPMPLQALLGMAQEKGLSGIGKAIEKDQNWYILFSRGEPDGAVLHDDKGTLFGNKAIYLLKGTEQFHFHAANHQFVERIILGCRVFDKNILNRGLSGDIPEMAGRVETRAGVFSMRLVKDGSPVPGQRVSLRKSGQVIANDFTSAEGKISFRLLFGNYECVVHSRDMSTRVYEFEFHAGLLNQLVTLDIT
ncbi:MAG: hypothetical protein MUC66_03785 [Methanolinea sp.]|nr:hypothetical protein [Methanolinea sp.]